MNKKPIIINTRKGKKNPPSIRVRSKAGAKKSVPSIMFNVITNIAVFALLLLSVFATVKVLAHDKDAMLGPEILGFRSTMVITDSMYPEIKAGALIISVKTPVEDYKIGDIVIYVVNTSTSEVKEVDENKEDASGSAVTHRIIDITSENGDTMFITKGDNSQSPDNPVHESRMQGRVIFHVNNVVKIFEYIRTPVGMITTGVILIILLFVLPLVAGKKEN